MNDIIVPTLFEHAIVLFFIGISIFGVFYSHPKMKGAVYSTPEKISTYWTNGFALIVASGVVVAAWLVAGRSLKDLGLTWEAHGPFALGLIALFAIWYVAEARFQLTGPRRAESIARLKRNTPFMPTTLRELRHWTFVALCAGVCEEIIFRGFLISYLVSFTGTSKVGLALAVALPALFFAVIHLYQGWRTVGLIFLMSLLFGAVFVLTGSLWLLMLLHFLVDLVGGFLTVRVIGQGSSDTETDGASSVNREFIEAS